MEKIIELNFNVDDMTAEACGYALDVLLEGGARDVFFTPVFMKKNRPGILFTVLCDESKEDEILRLIFKHTSTIGVRKKLCERFVLDRKVETVETCFGPVRKKTAYGYGVTREKYEYDDLAKIAKEKDLSIEEVLGKISDS